MKKTYKKIILFIIYHLATISMNAQTNLQGKIFDSQTKEPLPGVHILALPTQTGTVTSHNGGFVLNTQQPIDSLLISMVGYTSRKVKAETGQRLNFSLEQAAANLQTVVVSASREAQSRTEAPVAISRLTPKMIDEAKPVAVYEVLNKTPGVLMVNLNNEQHSMAIRQPMTTSGYYLYMEDGIGIRPMGVFNHNALLEINQFAIGSVEVVKGPVSSIYGPEAVGGTVNFITLRPTVVPTAKIGIQADQWGFRRLQFGGGARIGKFGISVGALSSTQKGSWMSASDYDKSAINTRMEYHFTPRTRLIGTFMYGQYNSQMSGSVDSIAFYKRAYISTSDFTYRKSTASRSRLTLEHDWASGSKTFVTLFNRYNTHGQNPSYAIRWTPGQATARGEINSNNFTSYGLIAQHSQQFDFWKAKLIAGLTHDYSPNQYWSYQIDLDAQLRPDKKSVEKYTIRQERPDIKIADYDAIINNTAAYLQYDFVPLKNIRVSLGSRLDRMSFTYNNALDQSSGAKQYQSLTNKIGLTYDLGKSNGLYANVSQGFAPPALTAIFRKRPNTNPAEFYYNLEPARFMNYEVGGWFSLLAHKLYADVALYQMDGQNELLNIRQPDNSFDYQSAGRTLHRGIELGLNYKPCKDFLFRWSGTSSLHRFEDFQVSNRQTDQVQNLRGLEMPSAPRWVWNTEASYYPQWLPGFRTALEWQYVSGWYQNQINTIRYDGYNLLNLRVGYQWKGIEVFTNLMNMTDALYATNVSRGNNPTDRATFTPAAPRTFVMGVQYNFTGKK